MSRLLRPAIVVLVAVACVFALTATAFAALPNIIYSSSSDPTGNSSVIRSVNPANGASRQLTRISGWWDNCPSYTLDRETVFFLRELAYLPVSVSTSICCVPAGGGPVKDFGPLPGAGGSNPKSGLTVGRGALYFADYRTWRYRGRAKITYRVVSVDLATKKTTVLWASTEDDSENQKVCLSLTAASDGTKLAFTREGTGEFILLDLVKKKSARPQPGIWIDNVVFSPDSRRILYSGVPKPTGKASESSALARVGYMTSSGALSGKPIVTWRVADNTPWIEACGWSPDMRQLLLAKQMRVKDAPWASLWIYTPQGTLVRGVTASWTTGPWGRVSATW